jgi:superfamily II RNA helicase
VATELMFNGVYNSLDAHQLVALVSCLVPSDKSEVTGALESTASGSSSRYSSDTV